MQKTFATHWRRVHLRAAATAVCVGGGLLTLVSAAALVGAPVAQAAACGGATVTATPMHSPDGTPRPFYAEFKSGSTKHSGYAGYELTDNAGVLGADVWVQLSTFTGGSLGLAANQPAGVPVRATSGSGKRLVYAYLTASAETTAAQSFTVEIWNGKPGLPGSTQVCTTQGGFSGVIDVLDAAANKITSVSVSTSAPAIGGSFSATAVGDTGTMGAGDASDQVGGNGVFSMSPSMEDAWPAASFTLTGVEVTLGGLAYRDRLRVYPGTAAAGAYTAVYTFTVRKGTTGVTPVRPVQNIASGTQVKYTGSYSGTLQDIAEPVVTTTLVKSPAGLTGPPYAITYEVVASNSSGSAVVLDYLRDTPTPSSAWTFVSGSARLNGSAIADPENDANTLVFKGPFTIPGQAGATAGTLTFRYTLQITATVANTVVGTVGDIEIGGSSGGSENEVTVNPVAPAITTSDVPDGVSGTAYSTTLAATSGQTPYSWDVSAGSLPAGLSLAAATGTISGTPTTAGTSTFTIRVTDAAAQTATRSFAATIAAPDSTAPTGASVEINAGAASTTTTSATLTLTATDAAGVTAYRVANGADCSGASWTTVTAATTFAGTAPLSLAGGDGTRTVCAQFRDAAGNASSTATDAIVLDATAPAGTITVASGAAYTTSVSVSVALAATDAVGVTGYRVADGSDCSGASWVVVASTASLSTSLTLTLSGADGAKTACVEYRDALGNVSATFTDAIVLDTAVPSVVLGSSAPDPTDAAFVVTAMFSEPVSGFSSGDVSLVNATISSFSGSGASYSFTVTPAAQGTVSVDVGVSVAVDAAGQANLAAAQLVRTYDSLAPAGTISVAGGAASTTSASVSVALAATDAVGVTGYRVAVEADCSGASWVAVASTLSFSTSLTLTLAGADGAKTVCVEYRDALGNLSATLTDAIVLDATAPTAALAVAGGFATTTTPSITVTPAAADAIGVSGYRIGSGSDCSAEAWIPVASTGTFSASFGFTLPGGDGSKTLCAQFRDAAGNVSSTALATITLDTSAPGATLTSSAAAVTASAPIPVTVTFSEPVVGFSATDVVLGNGTLSGLTGSGAVYFFDVTPASDGLVTVDVPAASASDGAGNANVAAAQLTRTYDTTPPAVSIVSRPAASTTAPMATIVYSVSDPLAGVTCSVDGGSPAPCATSFFLDGLTLGAHVVEISAVDAVGNAQSATVAWTIVTVTPATTSDTTPPAISILSRPPAVGGAAAASILFALDDPTVTTRCRLDNGPFIGCSEALSYSGLATGVHNVVIEAVDPAGNVATATVSWTVAKEAVPDVKVSITSTVSTVTHGQMFEMTATAQNVGGATATSVVLTVRLPENAEFVSGEARLVRARAV
ncbi:MAG: Ig-like domain-containing protein, partial [Actinomycetota bacterium]|nr:Ig-like domain-containing protein [Actinomycetota bacterium]